MNLVIIPMEIEGAFYEKKDSKAVFTGLNRNDKIVESLNNLEGYDIDEDFDLFTEVKMHDAGSFKELPETDKSKFNVFLGKDHLTTYSFIKSLKETDFGIIWMDAHADLKEQHPSSFGRRMSNTTVLRRILEFFPKENVVIFGLRSCAKEEKDFINENNIKVVYDIEELKEALKAKKKWYLSIDIDILDPVFGPAVDYPEPDGYSYFEIVEILRELFANTDIFAMDIVEVMSKEADMTSLHAAKLIQKSLVFKFKK